MGKIDKNQIEIDITECFADDSEYFWKNFAQWENEDFSGIYSAKKGLPDIDASSLRLYEFYGKLWTLQREKFKKDDINIPDVDIYEGKYLYLNDKKMKLSSDSFISIYWHWKRMKTLMLEIYDDKDNLSKEIDQLKNRLNTLKIKENDRWFSDKFSLYKTFIWHYLQYANTIGGFIVFPRIYNSINVKRANSPICDRFDLTLECIRRAYLNGYFDKSDDNPLFNISDEDKEFFKMFGTFENYAKFFCLNESYDKKHNWVTEDCSAVYDLLNENKEETLDNWDFNKKTPLPQNEKEWWTFYRNIMDRLEARNKQIKDVIEKTKRADR
ncbi:MAG: hypothetical protein IJ532_01865 [Alphaproteobacteria bacterium]|nr:hypothetical protein [Alphaproteobacteria bacterium]